MAMNGNISDNTMNTGVSLAFIEKILGLGLSLMTVEARKERMERVVAGEERKTTIDGQAFAALIDECRDALRLLVEEGNATTLTQEKQNEVMSIMYDCGCIISKDSSWLKNAPRKVWAVLLYPLAVFVYFKRFYKICKELRNS